MAIKYIDPLGTDDASHGTGPGENAWKSLEYALELGGLAHGDTLVLGAGQITSFYNGTGIACAISGVASTPLLIQGQGDETIIDIPPTVATFLFRNATGGNVKLENVKVTNSNSVSGKYFFQQSKSATDKVVFEGVNFSEIGAVNIGVSSGYRTSWKIKNCKIYGANTTSLIAVDGNGADIEIDGGIIADINAILTTANTSKLVIHNAVLAKFSNTAINLSALSGAAYEIDIYDNAVCVGGTSGSDSFINMSAHAGAYFRDNPEKFKFNRNKVWSFDGTWSGAMFNAIVSCAGAPPLMSGDNWFSDPGVTEAQVEARGVDIESVNFSAPAVYLNQNAIGLFGDSIMYGGVLENGDYAFQIIDEIITSVTVADNDNVSMPSVQTMGGYWLIDIAHTETAPKYLVFAIGVNDFVSVTGALRRHRTVSELAEDIQVIMQKHIAAGGVCMWLGVESVLDGADLTSIKALNSEMEQYCKDSGIKYRNILSSMELRADWKTHYYSDMSTDLHPNDAGQALIAELAEGAFIAETQGVEFGLLTPFDSTMPPLSLAPTAPGDLRSVQTWSKVATAQEIHKVTKDIT